MRTLSSRRPWRDRLVAIACLRGNRESNRYTRTFVSTSAATDVEILPPPTAIGAGSEFWPARLTAPLWGRRRVVQLEHGVQAQGGSLLRGRHDLDHGARGLPLDLVPGADTVSFGDRL